MTRLTDLPSPILQQIIQNILSSSSSSSPSSPNATAFLTQFGRNISAATRSTLYHTLTLPDQDAIFLQASSEGTGTSSSLDAILGNESLAQGVKVLIVTDMASEASGGISAQIRGANELETGGEPAHDQPDHALFSSVDVSVECASTSPITTATISTSNLLFLLTRLPNITSFEWRSSRPLPSVLTRALTLTARSLTSFSRSTSESTTSSEEFKFTPSSSSLSALPLSLTSLTLSHLSQKGLHNVSRSIRSQHLPNVARLELEACKFVDDASFEALAEGVKGLKRVVIKDMGGTKLTEKGLEEFFNGCEEIREVVFKEVEGRLSRSTWSSLVPSISSSLTTLSLTYSDSLPHKTWVLSHLSSTSSLISLVSLPSLHTLLLARAPLPPLSQDGSNSPQLSGKSGSGLGRKSPMIDLMKYEKWKLDEDVLKALVEKGEHGCGWRELDLSLWTIDQDQVKKLLGACASGGREKLGRLRISFDGPFKTLLALTSPLGASLSLRTLVVQIPPHHIPHSSPTYILSRPTTSPTIPTPTLKSSEDEIFPSPKEWKKFLKKSHSGLTKVVWDGRDGYGRWDFRKEGAGAWKVDYDPFGGEWEEENGGGGFVRSAVAPRGVEGGERREVSLVGTVLEGFTYGEDEEDGAGEEEDDEEDDEGGHHHPASIGMARGSSSSSSSSSSLNTMGLGLTGFTFPSYGGPIGGGGSTTLLPSTNSTTAKSGIPKERDSAAFDKDKSFPPLSPSSQYSTIASKKRSPSLSTSPNHFPSLPSSHANPPSHITTPNSNSNTIVFSGHGKSKSRSSSISSSHTTSSTSTTSTATTTNSPGNSHSRDRSSTAGSTSTTASSVGTTPETTKERGKSRSSSGSTGSGGRRDSASGGGGGQGSAGGKGGSGANASGGGTGAGMSRRRSTGTTNAGTAANGGTASGFGGSGGLGGGRGRKYSNA